MTPIATAIAPLKDLAQDAAEAFARKTVERVLADLKAHGMDSHRCAPYPGSSMSRREYAMAASKYYLYQRITGSATVSRSHRDPDIRVESTVAVETFIADARKEATASFDAFVAKLEIKVGAHSAALLVNDVGSLWGFSTLRVNKPDGTVQYWHTRQIVNVSKLGKLFNQWPTRQTKGAK